MKLNIKGDEVIIEDDGFLSQMISGCNGKVRLNTPFGKRKLKVVKKFSQKPDKK